MTRTAAAIEDYALDEEIARLTAERATLDARARSIEDDDRRAYALDIVRRCDDAIATLERAAAALSSNEKENADAPTTTTAPMTVTRVDALELTPKRFREEYVATDTPVVITGLGDVLTIDGARGAECEWLTRLAGNKKIAVTRNDAHRSNELSCATTDVVDLKDYVREVMEDGAPGSYLYDASIPLKLPSLAEAIRMPKYFAHDYLQKTMRMTAFSRSWPSLFVAARDTRSSLHVDQWHGHFFMAMVRGTKRWTVFDRGSTAFLRPSWLRGTLDPAMPNLEDQGLYYDPSATAVSEENDDARVSSVQRRLAKRWDVDLGPGEVLFVPGGAPHAVHNLDCTVAFAGNFVDDTNIDRALYDLKLMGLNQGARMMETGFAPLDEVDFSDETFLEDDANANANADATTTYDDLVVNISDYLSSSAR